jgi:radical SAM protein with 4Fe4S-binding SPASM domain
MMMPWKNFKRFSNKATKQPGYAARVLTKRAKAYFYYYFGQGKSSLPEAITLFLTHRCNLRCKMCGQWGESGVTKNMSRDLLGEELTFHEFEKFIDDVSVFRPNITLFGGEPLLYSHCLDLIKHIKNKKMHCLMITNGSLLNKFAEELIGAGLDELNLSLDGGKNLHDQIRGMPGLFERITNGLKEVNRIKKERGFVKPIINLQCTIIKDNYRRLDELLEVAKDVGADSLTFHNLIFLERDLIEKQKFHDKLLGCSSSNWEGFVFKPEIEPEVLYSKIREIMTRKHRFMIDFYPNFSLKGLKEYYENPAYLPSEYPAKCLSPWMTAYIFPNGEILPCLNFDYSYGNVKSDNFVRVWNGDSAIRYRKMLKDKGIFPVCVRCTELYRY